MLPTGHAEASAMHGDWSWIPQPWEGTCRQAGLQEQIYDCGTPHTLLVGSRVGPRWELAFTRSLTGTLVSIQKQNQQAHSSQIPRALMMEI